MHANRNTKLQIMHRKQRFLSAHLSKGKYVSTGQSEQISEHIQKLFKCCSCCHQRKLSKKILQTRKIILKLLVISLPWQGQSVRCGNGSHLAYGNNIAKHYVFRFCLYQVLHSTCIVNAKIDDERSAKPSNLSKALGRIYLP